MSFQRSLVESYDKFLYYTVKKNEVLVNLNINSSQKNNHLVNSFLDIQNFYTYTCKISEMPKVHVQELNKKLVGKLNIEAGSIRLVELKPYKDESEILNNLEIVVRPIFSKYHTKTTLHEDNQHYQYSTPQLERRNYYITVQHQLPILKLEIDHQLSDQSHIEVLEQALKVANNQFFEKNRSVFDYFKCISDIFT